MKTTNLKVVGHYLVFIGLPLLIADQLLRASYPEVNTVAALGNYMVTAGWIYLALAAWYGALFAVLGFKSRRWVADVVKYQVFPPEGHSYSDYITQYSGSKGIAMAALYTFCWWSMGLTFVSRTATLAYTYYAYGSNILACQPAPASPATWLTYY